MDVTANERVVRSAFAATGSDGQFEAALATWLTNFPEKYHPMLTETMRSSVDMDIESLLINILMNQLAMMVALDDARPMIEYAQKKLAGRRFGAR